MKNSVVIGRFQPFHSGHMSVVEKALADCDYLHLIVCSPNQMRTARDPFTFRERLQIIDSAIPEQYKNRVLVHHMYDVGNTELWSRNIMKLIGPGDNSLYVHVKNLDEYSYINSFQPYWNVVLAEKINSVNSTVIRECYYKNLNVDRKNSSILDLAWVSNRHHDIVLDNFKNPEIKNVVDMYNSSSYYITSHGIRPHITCDNVIIQNNKILLIKRKKNPYIGGFALPGGFFELGETPLEGAIRELYEETHIKLHEVTHGLSLGQHVVVSGDQDRDPRAIIISIAYGHILDDNYDIEIKAKDDAAWVGWIDLDYVRTNMKNALAFDHYMIIDKMVKLFHE